MLSKFFKQYLYIELSPQRVSVRDPNKQEVVVDVPEVAIQGPGTGKATILAIGSAARGVVSAPDTEVLNPFAHPRSLVSDFTLAEQVLKAFVRRVRGTALFQPNPVVIVHPLGEHEGGLTQVEIRALRELAFGVGAAEAHVWQGARLTNEQILSGEYPTTGKMLE
jgi:rod shape-determining protein MreB